MTTSIPVHTKVGAGNHPDAIMRHRAVLDVDASPGQAVFRAATATLRVLYETWARIEDTEAALGAHLGDGSARRGHNREAEFVRAVEAAFGRAAARTDELMREMKANRAALAKRVEAAIAHGDASLAAEIRAHVKSLATEADRLKAMSDAAAGLDRATLAAVVHAPPYLSGLSPRSHAAVRDAMVAAFAPQDAAQLATTDEVIAAVMSAGSRFVLRYGEALESVRPAAEADRATEALKGLADG
jgi:hypothetical protein